MTIMNCRGIGKLIKGVYGLVGLGVTNTVIDLSDAPGGDLSLDDIFGDNTSTPTTTEITPAPQVAQTTTPAEPVIKTKTGSVYKSIEDAVSGIEHKDTLIAQLREQVKKSAGTDPLAARPNPNAPVNYTVDQERYFEDIAKAVETKNTKAYMEAQQKLIWDSLGPLAPTISALGRANAERVVTEQIPEFKGFLSGDDYSHIAEQSPLLADAIKNAEGNPAASSQLAELYRIAYLSNQGRKLPELIQSVRNETPPILPRPTIQSTQLPAPSNNGVAAVAPTLDSREGRKAIIEQMEARGIGNHKW